jgi:hypothetical protein
MPRFDGNKKQEIRKVSEILKDLPKKHSKSLKQIISEVSSVAVSRG